MERGTSSPWNRDQAIERAIEYAKVSQLGDNLSVHEAYYSEAMGAVEIKRMEINMGRCFDEIELELLRTTNKSRWIVQLVFEACEHGATPQGPKVLVDDDGEISHFRPM